MEQVGTSIDPSLYLQLATYIRKYEEVHGKGTMSQANLLRIVIAKGWEVYMNELGITFSGSELIGNVQ